LRSHVYHSGVYSLEYAITDESPALVHWRTGVASLAS
jgi:hypothetical protein